jgi:hypothetical protein
VDHVEELAVEVSHNDYWLVQVKHI